MRLRQLSFILSLAWLFLHDHSHALTPDGKALLSFKMGIKDSDGVLSHWKEKDSDPCNWPGVTCNVHTKRVVVLNLPSHRLWGYISPDIGKLNQLRRLGLHQNSIFGTIPPALGNCSRLKALYLQDNFLSGSIPPELERLSELMILDISGNSLSGIIPASLGNLRKLSVLNVSTNFLVGEIPINGVLQNFTGDSFVGNLGLCGPQVNEICKSQLEGPIASPDSFSSLSPAKGFSGPSHFPQVVLQKPSKYSSELLISTLGTVGVSLFLAMLCFWGCFLYHKFWKKSKSPEIDPSTGAKVVFFHADLPYTSKEILRKIESLDDSNIIGYGGFGTVYRLIMDDGSIFAVKRIAKNTLGSDRLFERELEVLGSIKHRNLVNLRGYCNAPDAKLLIYDYLQNGSLDDCLHEQYSDVSFLLNWATRLKIATGAARGLAYLHHDCSPRIIHRDIKSSNILLGDNLEPHVSDFGLAKLLEDNDSHITTVVAGTFGYLAPEYLQSGRATAKTDVYSYGVVLLELISGRRPNDASFVEKGLNIVGWVNSLIREKNLKEILDPRCDGTSLESLHAVLHIATFCIKPDPEDRPTMQQIVKMLEVEIMSPCPSDFYDSASD